MAVRYQRSVSGNSYDPLIAPDSSEKIQEQSQAYIESLKRRREQETLQQAAFAEGMRRKVAAETQSLEDYSNRSMEQVKVLAQLQQQRELNEERRIQAANQAKSGVKNPAAQIVDFINTVAPMASRMVSQIDAANEARQKELNNEAVQIAEFLQNDSTIQQTFQTGLTREIAANKNGVIAAMEAAGAPPETIDAFRNANEEQTAIIQGSLAKGHMMGAFNAFQQNLLQPTDPENPYIITQADGSQVTLDQIGRSSSEQNYAWSQFRTEYAERGGFGYKDVSVEFMNDAYQVANRQWDQYIGGVRKNELNANKADKLDLKRQAFQIEVRDPSTAVGAVEDIYTAEYQDSLSHTAANGKLKEYLSNPNMVPQNVFDDLEQNLTLPGRPKPYALDRPADWAEIKEARQKAINQSYGLSTQTKQIEAQKQATQLGQMIAADMEGDQELNMSDEQFREMYSRFEAEGIPNDPRLSILRNNEKYLASTVQQQEQIKEFTRLAEKGALTEGMVFRSTLDPEQKKQLYRQITSGAVPKIDKETNRRAKEYIKGRLLERTQGQGYIPNSSEAKGYVNRAVDFALQKFQRDYVQFARGTDGKDPYQAAIGLFEAEYNAENGLYTTYGDDDIIKNGIDVKLKGTFKNNDFTVKPNYQAATAPEETLAEAYERYGDKTISSAGVVPKPQLESIRDDISMGRRGVIPPIISMMADRYNTDPLTVLEQQFKANDIEYDENYFKPAKEVVESINPVWKTYLNNNPQVETTDAALIGSGQQPIYQTITPAGRQVMNIVKSRESPVEGYNAMNNGTGGDRPGGAKRYFGKDFKDMTLNEVIDLQRKGLIHAAGAYQFVPNTLPEAMQLAGITGDMKFTPEVQDAMFMATFDKYGASKWAPYWGNPATQNEMNIMENFQRNFDYQKPTWRQSSNMNPKLVYRIGTLGYGSTGPHLDVKPVQAGGVYSDSSQVYEEGDLDPYVSVMHNGKLVPLSQGTVTTSDDAAHRARGSFGHDYATPDGTSGQQVYLTNGAKVIENWVDPSPNAQGSNRMVIELPNGKRYAFVHGKGVTNG